MFSIRDKSIDDKATKKTCFPPVKSDPKLPAAAVGEKSPSPNGQFFDEAHSQCCC